MPNDALKDVHFGPGSLDVLKADVVLLNSVAAWLTANANGLVLIEGHTDDRGTWQQNLMVSERRARPVMGVLVAKGVEAPRMTGVTPVSWTVHGFRTTRRLGAVVHS
jgi:outer membrane protein OmpA-like peptidoglycan-associated protein